MKINANTRIWDLSQEELFLYYTSQVMNLGDPDMIALCNINTLPLDAMIRDICALPTLSKKDIQGLLKPRASESLLQTVRSKFTFSIYLANVSMELHQASIVPQQAYFGEDPDVFFYLLGSYHGRVKIPEPVLDNITEILSEWPTYTVMHVGQSLGRESFEFNPNSIYDGTDHKIYINRGIMFKYNAKCLFDPRTGTHPAFIQHPALCTLPNEREDVKQISFNVSMGYVYNSVIISAGLEIPRFAHDTHCLEFEHILQVPFAIVPIQLQQIQQFRKRRRPPEGEEYND